MVNDIKTLFHALLCQTAYSPLAINHTLNANYRLHVHLFHSCFNTLQLTYCSFFRSSSLTIFMEWFLIATIDLFIIFLYTTCPDDLWYYNNNNNNGEYINVVCVCVCVCVLECIYMTLNTVSAVLYMVLCRISQDIEHSECCTVYGTVKNKPGH